MLSTRQYIAVDLGAESGRVILGTVAADKLELEEKYRFGNGALQEKGTLRWDFKQLFGEVCNGITETIKSTQGKIAGIAVDSWGVDFGLLDGAGHLIENPYHYRDSRTNGMLEKAYQLVPKREIYSQTGIQFMQINGLYQLLSMKLAHAESLARAKHLVMMADLVGHHLCGEIYGEYSLLSTGQFLDMKTGRYPKVLFEKLGLPLEIMPKIVPPGTVAGKLKQELSEQFRCAQIMVIAAGSHDTACAVAAVPAQAERWAYISSGTWSLIGVEMPQAIINDKTFEHQFTNEGGVHNTIRLLKNIMGLWLVQECRRRWHQQGREFSYRELTQMAGAAKPFAGYVDPDYPDFLSPGDMPDKINKYLTKTNQPATQDQAEIIRIILESLAWKYRRVLDSLEDIIGAEIDVIHIVGGGIQNELLCQFAADATGKKVITGPVEATAAGNIMMQAIACGQIKSLAQGRKLIRNSFDLKEYKPQNTQAWDKQYLKISKK